MKLHHHNLGHKRGIVSHRCPAQRLQAPGKPGTPSTFIARYVLEKVAAVRVVVDERGGTYEGVNGYKNQEMISFFSLCCTEKTIEICTHSGDRDRDLVSQASRCFSRAGLFLLCFLPVRDQVESCGSRERKHHLPHTPPKIESLRKLEGLDL